MATQAEQVEGQFKVSQFKVQHPISAYTFPCEARIHQVHFDDEYIHIGLSDGRILSVPLRWIPTLHHALPEEREKYEFNQSRTMIIWDPGKCAINDELRLADYLGPCDSSLVRDSP